VVELDAAEVVAALVAAGNRKDLAVQYAHAFAEYREASKNIAEHGTVCQHPRTANVIVNPYVAIRDAALRKLQNMRTVKGAETLW
jgi:phage terminase small subunit